MLKLIPFKWSIPDNTEKLDNYQKVLESWGGTKYMLGQSHKGIGCDCIGFVFKCLSDLCGRDLARGNIIPSDTAIHNRDKAMEAVKLILSSIKNYEHIAIDGSDPILPGDIFLTGTDKGSIGHSMIAGTKQSHVWQCTEGIGVHRTGLAWSSGGIGLSSLTTIIRMTEIW